MEYLPYVFGGVVTFLYLLERFWNRKDVTKMLDRLMVFLDHKSFEAYQYYDKKYPKDLQELDKIRKDERKMRTSEEVEFSDDRITDEKRKKLKNIMRGYAEDWGEDEVDIEELLKQNEEEDKTGEINGENELAQD